MLDIVVGFENRHIIRCGQKFEPRHSHRTDRKLFCADNIILTSSRLRMDFVGDMKDTINIRYGTKLEVPYF